MKRIITLISLIATANLANAQESISVGQVLDLEERILLKQMTDELNKPSPHAPATAPVVVTPKAPKIAYPTETLAVYGTSDTFYEGQLSFDGKVYTVRKGMRVQDYVVTSVSLHGIELTKTAAAPSRGKRSVRPQPNKVVFAPLVVR